MKKLSNEAELKKSVAYKNKACNQLFLKNIKIEYFNSIIIIRILRFL